MQTYTRPRRIHGLSDKDRFWRYVDKSGDCWLWMGHRDHIGYGRSRRFPENFAHRTAWHLTIGPIPKGKKVLHRCDNPPCVNPAHLFLGTQADNMLDMRSKGRQPVNTGLRNPNCKLTPTVVKRIRIHLARGVSQNEIADKFGIGQSHVSRIHLNRVWAGIK